MKSFAITVVTFLVLIAAGCGGATPDESNGLPRGESGKPDSFLAYEHVITVSVAGEALSERIATVRAACADGRFGACSMLESAETSGEYPSGKVVVRIVPEGVEPLAALASEGGEVGSRSTRAEDLAEDIANTSRQKEQLEIQHAKLIEFQARKDLSVSDMLSLARELAAVESNLAEVNRTASAQQRQLETNLLTMFFSADRDSSSWSGVTRAASGALDSLTEGAAQAIEIMAFGLPFLLIAFPLALLWRHLWRRATSKGGARAS